MHVHRDRCPNCARQFCFAVEFSGNPFRVLCPHCYLGYDLLSVELETAELERLIACHQATPFWRKPESFKHIFRYLCGRTQKFRFAVPAHSNAVVFLVAQTKSAWPLAVYFQQRFHILKPPNRLLFSITLSLIGAGMLLSMGLSPLPVAIGTLTAQLCFQRLSALPKIKGPSRTRLKAEQALLKQSYQLQQSLNQVAATRISYESLYQRQVGVLEKMRQTPTQYPTQISLYQRTLQTTQDYLALCNQAIHRYEAAIRSIVIQIETSKLAVELPSNFDNPRITFGLDHLENQLQQSLPPNPDHDSDH